MCTFFRRIRFSFTTTHYLPPPSGRPKAFKGFKIFPSVGKVFTIVTTLSTCPVQYPEKTDDFRQSAINSIHIGVGKI